MDSSSPGHGEKASYYSAVCLETDGVQWMELEGNSNGERSVALLELLRERRGGRLGVIWDNAPARPFGKLRRGPAMRSYLEDPGPDPATGQPACSPDFNVDEAVWVWVREEANGNVCLGNREAVQDRVGKFLAVLTGRKDEVRRRCGTVLQSRAGALLRDSRPESRRLANAHPSLALVYVRSSGGPWQFIKEQGARKQRPPGCRTLGTAAASSRMPMW